MEVFELCYNLHEMSKKSLVRVKPKLVSFPPIIQGMLSYLPALVPFLTENPLWILPFAAVASLYSAYMILCQEEVNEIIEFIEEHPSEFREEIINTKEFRKGFIFFMHQYLKERAKEKRKIAKSIFFGYTVSENKHDFELERLNDCLVRMTIPTLKDLIFMKKDIIPVLEKQINEELTQPDYQTSDMSKEWWFDDMMTKKSIWVVIDKWLNDTYSPSTDKVKKDYKIKEGEDWTHDLRSRAQNRERDKRNQINESVFELVTLGILRINNPGATWGGGGGTDYALTTFGLKFLKQIDDVG